MASAGQHDDGEAGPSQRPYQTISALSARLGIEINTSFRKKKYPEMVTGALASSGVVLIWLRHELV